MGCHEHPEPSKCPPHFGSYGGARVELVSCLCPLPTKAGCLLRPVCGYGELTLLTDNVSLLQELEIFGGPYSVPWDVETSPLGRYNFTVLDVLLPGIYSHEES